MTATFVPYHDATDGSRRIRVTVDYPLCADDLAQILASAHRDNDPAELPLLRYTDAVRTLREELRTRGGRAPFLWRSSVTAGTAGAERADAVERWARQEMTRNFPALSPRRT